METEMDRKLREAREQHARLEQEKQLRSYEAENKRLQRELHPSTLQRVGAAFGSLAGPPQRAPRPRVVYRTRKAHRVHHRKKKRASRGPPQFTEGPSLFY